VRITAFDTTTEEAQLILRAVIDYWWAPFHDAKRDLDATALTDAPWARPRYWLLKPPVEAEARVRRC
jgi:hypothetical protein